MRLEIIRELSIRYKGGFKGLASDIGMSESNLHRCCNINRIEAGKLELIAKKLGVHVSIFFDEQPGVLQNINNLRLLNTIKAAQAQSRTLQETIQDVLRQIEEKLPIVIPK